MLSNLYRCLIRVTDKVHDPKRPRTLMLSRRAFTRALALVAFGGVARPASPRVLSSALCQCDAHGQCTGGCEPNLGHCNTRWPSPAGANCWCQAKGDGVWAHVCDCVCPGAEIPYCNCNTMDYQPCQLG